MTTVKPNQISLIPNDAELMQGILSMPKIDLHRHLTGAINAKIAVKIAAKYRVQLPTYISSELEAYLFRSRNVENLREYFSPWWDILNSMFASKEATHDIIMGVIEQAQEDNIIYLELRTGPRGFLGYKNFFTFEEYLNTIAETVAEANAKYKITTRFVLGIPRHIFGPISIQVRNRMFAKIISILSAFRDSCFVGVDLNGEEELMGGKEFKIFFEIAKDKGFGITVHAGECGSAFNVRHAVEELYAQRIGHGIAAAKDDDLLRILSDNNCALEICPETYRILKIISQMRELPLRVLQKNGVPFVICTDNPARNQTSLSEEYFKVSKAFGLSLSDLRDMVSLSLRHSFASDAIKEKIARELV